VGEGGLAHAGDVFQQQVAAGDQRLHGAPHDLGLAAQGPLHVGAKLRSPLDSFFRREAGRPKLHARFLRSPGPLA
jgi:hypothetical protein